MRKTQNLPESETADHIIPLSRGGKDEPDNIVAACGECNRAKADTMPTLTTDQLRALGLIPPADQPARLPDPRPYSYERACELLGQTIAMLESRTREHEAAIRLVADWQSRAMAAELKLSRVSASAAVVADLLSGLEGSSLSARAEAIRICDGIAMKGRP